MIFRTPELTAPYEGLIAVLGGLRDSMRHALREPRQWTGLLRRNLTAKAIQGSNSIEGYIVTFDEAIDIVEGDDQATVDDDTRQALIGYRKAMSYILQLWDDQHLTVNEELIRSLHYMMISHDHARHPGKWRPGAIFVRRSQTGEKVYEGPEFDKVQPLMHEFVQSLQKKDDAAPVVVRAAMAHLNLVMIHPFSDGNGRMARALQTLVLARDGILAPTFSSIEEYLGSRTNTEAYYAVLAEVGAGRWSPERDALPWVEFCLKAHVHQAWTVQRRIREIERLWDELESELRRKRLPERGIFALYDAAIGRKVRSPQYRVAAEVSNVVASRDFKALVDAGFLIPKGERRGRYYVASELLGLIRERTREQKIAASQAFAGQLDLPL